MKTAAALACLLFPALGGHAYTENFKRFPAGKALPASSQFEPITTASKPWLVVDDAALGGRALSHDFDQNWSGLRNRTQNKGYIDLEADLDISKGQANLFFNVGKFHQNTLPIDGYYFQASTGYLYRGYGGRKPVLIGLSTVQPADKSKVHVQLRDNGGLIEVMIDRQSAIRVVDLLYDSGYWGLSGQGAPGALSNFRLNENPRPPRASIPTPNPTPTPPFTPQLCPPPWPKVWKVRPRPVLKPETDYDKGCVNEPSVLKIGKTYHMTYSANAFALPGVPPTIGLAVSDDGISWTHYGKNPVLGNKFGGEDGTAIRSSQLKIGDDYYIYYKNGFGDICRAVSTDGYSYTKLSATVIPFNCLNQYTIVSFDSTGFYQEPEPGVWDALVDANYGVTSGDQFRLWLFRSHDNAATFQPVCLLSSIPEAKTDFGSPRAFVKIGKLWHLWYLYDVPSKILEAVSPDLYNWTSYKEATLDYSEHMFGLQTCNQAADTCLLDMGDRLFLYYDGTDNTAKPATTGFGCGIGYPAGPGGVIGMAIFEGSLADYGACGGKVEAAPAPAWTPTPPHP